MSTISERLEYAEKKVEQLRTERDVLELLVEDFGEDADIYVDVRGNPPRIKFNHASFDTMRHVLDTYEPGALYYGIDGNERPVFGTKSHVENRKGWQSWQVEPRESPTPFHATCNSDLRDESRVSVKYVHHFDEIVAHRIGIDYIQVVVEIPMSEYDQDWVHVKACRFFTPVSNFKRCDEQKNTQSKKDDETGIRKWLAVGDRKFYAHGATRLWLPTEAQYDEIDEFERVLLTGTVTAGNPYRSV